MTTCSLQEDDLWATDSRSYPSHFPATAISCTSKSCFWVVVFFFFLEWLKLTRQFKFKLQVLPLLTGSLIKIGVINRIMCSVSANWESLEKIWVVVILNLFGFLFFVSIWVTQSEHWRGSVYCRHLWKNLWLNWTSRGVVGHVSCLSWHPGHQTRAQTAVVFFPQLLFLICNT